MINNILASIVLVFAGIVLIVVLIMLIYLLIDAIKTNHKLKQIKHSIMIYKTTKPKQKLENEE